MCSYHAVSISLPALQYNFLFSGFFTVNSSCLHQCSICGFVTLTPDSLARHIFFNCKQNLLSSLSSIQKHKRFIVKNLVKRSKQKQLSINKSKHRLGVGSNCVNHFQLLSLGRSKNKFMPKNGCCFPLNGQSSKQSVGSNHNEYRDSDIYEAADGNNRDNAQRNLLLKTISENLAKISSKSLTCVVNDAANPEPCISKNSLSNEVGVAGIMEMKRLVGSQDKSGDVSSAAELKEQKNRFESLSAESCIAKESVSHESCMATILDVDKSFKSQRFISASPPSAKNGLAGIVELDRSFCSEGNFCKDSSHANVDLTDSGLAGIVDLDKSLVSESYLNDKDIPPVRLNGVNQSMIKIKDGSVKGTSLSCKVKDANFDSTPMKDVNGTVRLMFRHSPPSHSNVNRTVKNKIFEWSKRRVACSQAKFSCSQCSKQFSKRLQYKKHIVKSHLVFKCKCVYCGRGYNDKGKYESHCKLHEKVSSIMSHAKEALLSASHEGWHDNLSNKQDNSWNCIEFVCPNCNKTFVNVSDMKHHLRTHDNDKLHSGIHRKYKKNPSCLSCRQCGKKFSSAQKLDKHTKAHKGSHCLNLKNLSGQVSQQNGQKYFCSHCGIGLASEKRLFRHERMIHPVKKAYICPHCQRTFTYKGNLEQHCINQHSITARADVITESHDTVTKEEVDTYKCPFCGKLYTSKFTARRHCILKHKCKLPSDLLCTQGLQNVTVNMLRDFQSKCPICKVKFANVWHLKRHLSIHLGIKNFHCKRCGRLFREKSSLKRHLKGVHCVKDNDLIIDLRDQNRPSTGNTIDKAQIHQNFHCKRCGRLFREKSSLKRHLKRFHHVKDKDLIIDLRDQNRPSSGNKMDKVQIHQNFHCKRCGRLFGEKSSLKRHLKRVHRVKGKDLIIDLRDQNRPNTGNKMDKEQIHPNKTKEKVCELSSTSKNATRPKSPHQCSICKRVLSTIYALKTHSRIHSDIKQYTCTICSRAFRRKHHLERHICLIHKTSMDNSPIAKTPVNYTAVVARLPQTSELVANPIEVPLKDTQSCSMTEFGNVAEKVDCKQLSVKKFNRQSSQLRSSGYSYQFQETNESFHTKGNTFSNLKKKGTRCTNQIRVHSSVHLPRLKATPHSVSTSSKTLHVCPHCSKQFLSFSHLQKHCIIHDITQPIKCCYCTDIFHSISSMKRHALFYCKHKPMNNKSERTRKQAGDVESQHRVHRVNTQSLKTKGRSTGGEPAHVTDVTDSKRQSEKMTTQHPCPVCNQKFSTKLRLQSHTTMHKNRKAQDCLHCDKQFHNNRTLKSHLESVHGGAMQMTLNNSNDLANPSSYFSLMPVTNKLEINAQMTMQMKPKSRLKPKRPTIGYTESMITLPLQDSLMNSTYVRFICLECGRKFTRQLDLRKHQHVHTESTLHQCQSCFARFTKKRYLIYHHKLHSVPSKLMSLSEIRSHVPEIDNKTVNSKSPFQQISMDNKVNDSANFLPVTRKIIFCQKCGQSFTHKSHLANHSRVHRGELKWKCSECGAKFLTKRNLRFHIKLHKSKHGLIDLSAVITGKAAVTSVKHTPRGKMYHCFHCGRNFKRKTAFLSHRRVHMKDREKSSQGNMHFDESTELSHRKPSCKSTKELTQECYSGSLTREGVLRNRLSTNATSCLSTKYKQENDAFQTNANDMSLKNGKENFCVHITREARENARANDDRSVKDKIDFQKRNPFRGNQKLRQKQSMAERQSTSSKLSPNTKKVDLSKMDAAVPQYNCWPCENSFDNLKSFKSHISEHQAKCTFKCGYCPAKYLLLFHLLKHQQICAADRPPNISVEFLTEVTSSAGTGIKVIAELSPEKSCGVANGEEKQATHVKKDKSECLYQNNHNFIHRKNYEWQCKFCNLTFSSRHKLVDLDSLCKAKENPHKYDLVKGEDSWKRKMKTSKKSSQKGLNGPQTMSATHLLDSCAGSRIENMDVSENGAQETVLFRIPDVTVVLDAKKDLAALFASADADTSSLPSTLSLPKSMASSFCRSSPVSSSSKMLLSTSESLESSTSSSSLLLSSLQPSSSAAAAVSLSVPTSTPVVSHLCSACSRQFSDEHFLNIHEGEQRLEERSKEKSDLLTTLWKKHGVRDRKFYQKMAKLLENYENDLRAVYMMFNGLKSNSEMLHTTNEAKSLQNSSLKKSKRGIKR